MDGETFDQYQAGVSGEDAERWHGVIDGAMVTLQSVKNIIDTANTPEQAIDRINAVTQQFAMDMILISMSQMLKEARDDNAG